jgi:hypothetical protein
MTMAEAPSDTKIGRRVAESFDKQGFMTTLGARLLRVAPGEVEIELPVGPLVSQQHGFVHAGAVAAIVVTFFTFLPSFIFILAGGPVVESTHGKLGFTAPLSAITAAVVGVILNLALFFSHHVLWPQGFGGHFDVVSALVAMAAAVALFRFKVGVLPLLGGCAALGLAVTLVVPGWR